MLLLLVILLAAVVAAVSQLPPNSKSQTTWKGVVTDSMCGAKHMMSGDDAKCVRTCLKGGAQYALVVNDKVHTLIGHSEELDKLAGETVEVAGTINNDGAIQVTSVQSARASGSASATTKSQSNDDATTARPVTIEGLVRDVSCPIQNKKATARNFNLKCALDCARLGSPLIILTDDGTLYVPISSSMPDQDQRSRLMPFVGKYVRVQGQVFERQGTHAIMIQDITELKDVHLITDAE